MATRGSARVLLATFWLLLSTVTTPLSLPLLRRSALLALPFALALGAVTGTTAALTQDAIGIRQSL